MTSLIKISLLLFLTMSAMPHSFGQHLAPLAMDFIESLDPELKKQACFPFDHTERFNWHFVPRERKGPTFHDFNAQQKAAALALMRASLGKAGIARAEAIFELENVLREVENRPPDDSYRDPLNYHFSIFGLPDKSGEWGWRLEGHHLSLNFSSSKGTLTSATPSFMGANPGIVLSGPQMDLQVLAEETNLGFDLLASLSESQKQMAKFSDEAPLDIITSNDRSAQVLDPKGLSYRSMNSEQQSLLKKLVHVYLSRNTAEYQKKLLDRIMQAGWDSFSFAWAGSEINQVGEPHYYRLQGADLLIEYDNVQNNANHVHTVIRDLQADFGGDLLQSHYQQDHMSQGFSE
ncbi:MAG: DUF3500 domain-containing protein [Cyclobacterium sp.]|uniref:DUF3500 domain-containing protein n=1 Tax=Cyclobacterium sp. TaxID=1966343 RepID=UPI003970D116